MIPVYRAKKIDSDEYVKGYLVRADDYDADVDEDQVIYFIMDKMENYRTSEVWDFVQNSRIDPTTLSIHFPNIIDSQGNKIFASLDIKGGSLIEYEEKIFEAMYLNGLIQGVANMDSIQNSLFKYSKIIGIQQ